MVRMYPFLGRLTTVDILDLPVEKRKSGNRVYDVTSNEFRMYGVDAEVYPSVPLFGGSSGGPIPISGVGNPNGTVIGQFGQTYMDTSNSLFYKCASLGGGTSWMTI